MGILTQPSLAPVRFPVWYRPAGLKATLPFFHLHHEAAEGCSFLSLSMLRSQTHSGRHAHFGRQSIKIFAEGIRGLYHLPFTPVDHDEGLMLRAAELASEARLPVYNALYIALSEGEGATLLASDLNLLEKQKSAPRLVS